MGKDGKSVLDDYRTSYGTFINRWGAPACQLGPPPAPWCTALALSCPCAHPQDLHGRSSLPAGLGLCQPQARQRAQQGTQPCCPFIGGTRVQRHIASVAPARRVLPP